MHSDAVSTSGSTGPMTGQLVLTSWAHSSENTVLATLNYMALHADDADQTHGPNGRGCSNGAETIDEVEYDERFTCRCVLVLGSRENRLGPMHPGTGAVRHHP